MCTLCGVLGSGEYWADAAPRPGVYTSNTTPIERRRARAKRVRIANRILAQFGMTLSDWQGASFLLSTRTGKTAVIQDLGHLWHAAERLGGRVCDPLALPVIERQEREGG